MHVLNNRFKKFILVVTNLCNLRLFENKFVCTVLTDLLSDFAENCDTCTLYDDACLK